MSNETKIGPFRVDMPDEMIADLRRRITATRWPHQELVADGSQGIQLATIQELARYWTAGVPLPHLLPRGRQGRPLRRLGRARAVL